MKKMVKGVLILAVLMAVFNIIGLGGMNNVDFSVVPSEIITCQGCELMQNSRDSFSAWVKSGSSITLIVPDGYSNYSWRGGGKISIEKSFTVEIKSDTVYTLTLNGGDRVKTVQIYLVSQEQNDCLPDLGKIDIESTTLAVGQEISISEDINYGNCAKGSGAVFSWIIDEEGLSGLSIKNRLDTKTSLIVKSKPVSGKNPVLRAQVKNNKGWVHEESIMLVIIDNKPPTIAGLYSYTAPLSYRKFTVDCNKCLTGANTNEYGDFFTNLKVTVRNKDGSILATGSDSVGKNDKRKLKVTMTLGNECDCTIEVNATDSFGASTTVRDLLAVGFGNTEDDIPNIKVKVSYNGPIYTIDASGTNVHSDVVGLSLRYEIKTVSGFQPLYNIEGNLCASEKCITALPQTGNEIKVIACYIREGRLSGNAAEKTVIVSGGGPLPAISPVSTSTATVVVQSTPAITQKAIVQQTYLPVTQDTYDRPKASGTGIFAAIVIIMVVALLKNNKRKR